MPSDPDLAYAARVRPVIDRVYRGLRRAGGPPGRAVVERHGVDIAVVGVLNDLYPAILARPLRRVEIAGVKRYVDPDDLNVSLSRTIDGGLAYADADRVALTPAGRDLLLDLEAAIADAAVTLWGPAAAAVPRLNELLARLLTAGSASGGVAFTAMAPPYEPAAAPAALRFCNRLGALRHHRADAHAAAWAAAGLDAASMEALDDPHLRQVIEDDTNRRDAPIYAALSDDDRWTLLADLGALPG